MPTATAQLPFVILDRLRPGGDPGAAAERLVALARAGRLGPSPAPTPYRAAQAAFEARERRLEAEDALAAPLLDAVRGALPAPPPAVVEQHTVPARGRSGAAVAVRFIVENARQSTVVVRFRPGEATTEAGEALWAPVGFAPARPSLAPGERCTVAMEADLRGVLPEGGRLELPVDVLFDGVLAQKLWVRVQVEPAP